MTATTDMPRAAAPWHFWVLGVVGFIWSCLGGYDYTMSHAQGDAYYRAAHMSAAQIAVMDAYPVWMHAVWAIGVWGSVVGAILLLLRMRWSFHAYVLSTLGAIGSLGYSVAVAHVTDTMGLAFPVLIIAVCLFFCWYCSAMAKRGVLR
jgi:hypothetical protein